MTFLEIPTKERPDRLVRYDAPLLAIKTTELHTYLLQLINALFNKAKTEEALNSSENAQQALQLPKRLNTLAAVASDVLGTHNLKYPNAGVKQGGIFQQDQAHYDYPFVSSKTTQLTRTLGGAGNAAAAAEIRFLSTEFLLEQQRTGISAVLQAQTGAVWEHLLQLGLPEADAISLGKQLTQRTTQAETKPVDRLLKQVFFPRDHNEQHDIIITPILHFGLAREFHSRLKQRRNDSEWISTHNIKVGGANPINAGPHNAEIGGVYHHLAVTIPRQQHNPIQQLLANLEKHATIFPNAQTLMFDTRIFKSSAIYQASNKESREEYQTDLFSIVQQLLQAPLSLADWLQKNTHHTVSLHDLSELEQRFLQALIHGKPRLSSDDIQKLSRKCLSIFEKAQHYDGEPHKKPNYLLDDTDKQDLQKAISQHLRELV